MSDVELKTIEQSELIHLEVARQLERRLRRELGEAGWISMKHAVSRVTKAALAV